MRATRRTRDEHGSVSIQMVVLMPAVLLVLFLGVQAGVYYHARSLALAAAQEGAREASGEAGTQASGLAAARSFLTHAAGDSLSNVNVTGSRTATQATITVRGSSLTLVPGLHLRVSQSASAPVERLTP